MMANSGRNTYKDKILHTPIKPVTLNGLLRFIYGLIFCSVHNQCSGALVFFSPVMSKKSRPESRKSLWIYPLMSSFWFSPEMRNKIVNRNVGRRYFTILEWLDYIASNSMKWHQWRIRSDLEINGYSLFVVLPRCCPGGIEARCIQFLCNIRGKQQQFVRVFSQDIGRCREIITTWVGTVYSREEKGG
jgi:hypothetical protein